MLTTTLAGIAPGENVWAGPAVPRLPVAPRVRRLPKLLRRMERQCRTLLAGAPDYAHFLVSPNGYVRTWNDQSQRMFQRLGREIHRRHVRSLYPASEACRVDSLLRKAASEGRAEEEGWCRRKTKTWFWANTAASCVRNRRGVIQGFVIVTRDLSERLRFEEEVAEAAVRERRRLSQDLHDSVGQELTGLAMFAQAHCDRMSAAGPEAAAAAQRLVRGLRDVLHQVRRMSRGLCPADVDGDELPSALSHLCESSSVAGGPACSFQCQGDATFLDALVPTTLYRIAQEALANAIKHAQAKWIRIQLECDASSVLLRIIDDGVGISSPPQAAEGIGLRTMRYRAQLIRGCLRIVREKGGGTAVVCDLPRDA